MDNKAPESNGVEKKPGVVRRSKINTYCFSPPVQLTGLAFVVADVRHQSPMMPSNLKNIAFTSHRVNHCLTKLSGNTIMSFGGLQKFLK